MSHLEVADVNAYYDESHVLHGVSLTVESDQLVTLIGRNGAGKTTTLNSIMGLMPRVDGQITFGSADLTGLEPYEVSRQGLSLVPEHRQIFPGLTVRENLRMGLIGHESETEFEELSEQVVDFFPRLEERYDQEATTMSGGEQQMLAIGRSLMSEPDLLLIDEPTEGLMPSLVEKLRDILTEINERGISVLLVEQNIDLALDISDYAYVISEGVIEAEGAAADIKEDEEIKEEYLKV
jgi:branched-chain amino acid transport system ATP-binding protein